MPSWFFAGVVTFVATVVLSVLCIVAMEITNTFLPIGLTILPLFPVWVTFLSMGLSNPPAPESVQYTIGGAVILLTGLGYGMLGALWETMHRRLGSPQAKRIWISGTIIFVIAVFVAPFVWIMTNAE